MGVEFRELWQCTESTGAASAVTVSCTLLLKCLDVSCLVSPWKLHQTNCEKRRKEVCLFN